MQVTAENIHNVRIQMSGLLGRNLDFAWTVGAEPTQRTGRTRLMDLSTSIGVNSFTYAVGRNIEGFPGLMINGEVRVGDEITVCDRAGVIIEHRDDSGHSFKTMELTPA